MHFCRIAIILYDTFVLQARKARFHRVERRIVRVRMVVTKTHPPNEEILGLYESIGFLCVGQSCIQSFQL